MFTLLHRETGAPLAELDEHGLQRHCGLQLIHRHDGDFLRNISATARVILLSDHADELLPIATTHAIQPKSLIDVGPFLIRFHAEPDGNVAPPPVVARHSIRIITSRRRSHHHKGPFVPDYLHPR